MATDKSRELFDKALQWIYSRKFSNVRAKIEPFDEPRSFHRKQDDTLVTPDITAMRSGKKSYFDIVLKSQTRRQLTAKWQLMQALAKRKGGKLYLFAPYGHKAFAERLIERFGINAKVVKLA